ncbi:MAG: hypothetical protein ACR2PQ_04035 [Myxococcota bacterium]
MTLLRPAALACLPAVFFALGCATTPPARRFDFFAAQAGADPWRGKVVEWQERERRDRIEDIRVDPESPTVQAAKETGLLHAKLGAFEAEERRVLAARIVAFSQVEARRHYRHDASRSPEDDHWPTARELLEQNGDDCDGMDLTAYQMMREFGFSQDEVYRAIIRRDRDGRNHMVTLWFEDPRDPWVLDATGAMSRGLARLSKLPGWTPRRIFNDHRQFGVVETSSGPLARH